MPLAIFSSLLAAWLPAQGVRISPPLPRLPHGDVVDFQLDGNGGVLSRGDWSHRRAGGS